MFTFIFAILVFAAFDADKIIEAVKDYKQFIAEEKLSVKERMEIRGM